METRSHLRLRFLSSLGFLKLQPELVFVTIALLSVSWWLSPPSSMWISSSLLRLGYPVHVFILRYLKSIVEVGRVQSLNKMGPPVLVPRSRGTSSGDSLPRLSELLCPLDSFMLGHRGDWDYEQSRVTASLATLWNLYLSMLIVQIFSISCKPKVIPPQVQCKDGLEYLVDWLFKGEWVGYVTKGFGAFRVRVCSWCSCQVKKRGFSGRNQECQLRVKILTSPSSPILAILRSFT